MTRKDFVLIADTLKAAKPALGPHDASDMEMQAQLALWTDMAESFGTALARTNPAFDRTRFLTACGVV